MPTPVVCKNGRRLVAQCSCLSKRREYYPNKIYRPTWRTVGNSETNHISDSSNISSSIRFSFSRLENLDNGKRERLPDKNEASDTSRPVFGVITYSINDARSGEFDDCPVM